MDIELNIFNKEELIRACRLIGYKDKNEYLSKSNEKELRDLIYKKINPNKKEMIEQYQKTLKLLKEKYDENDNLDLLKNKLYVFTCKKLNEAIKKMSKKKREKLIQKIENSIDSTTIDDLRKVGRQGFVTGSGILAIQGGAIIITGSNLGICMLLTSGLSSISALINVTFPFAAYTGAAVVGGKILGVAAFLANPFVATSIVALGLYQIFIKVHNRQYINLAGINYLIETKKQLEKT